MEDIIEIVNIREHQRKMCFTVDKLRPRQVWFPKVFKYKEKILYWIYQGVIDTRKV